MPENHFLEKILKHYDRFFTIQRKVIIEELAKMTHHPTAEDIYLAVKKKMPKMSLGTVYRNLTLMQELGLVDRLQIRGLEEARFEVHKGPHYHVFCEKCRQVEDIVDFRSASLEPTVQNRTGFLPTGHDLTVYGVCRGCQE